jgi:aminoglycoside phosphotransferase (APT) family kinase protein
VVWLLAIDRCLSEGIGVPRLEGLPGRDETLARWREATGLATDAAPYYEVLALCKFAVIMARIGLQMKHYGIAPPEATFDAENLATVVLGRALDELGAPTRA